MQACTVKGACQEAIRQVNADAATKSFRENAWGERHARAFANPNTVERGIVHLILALATYADGYSATCGEGDGIGTDGYANVYFADMLKAVRGLLSMETGRLDCGTLDSMLYAIGKAAGFTQDELES